MAVKNTVTEKSNPQNPDAPKKWYANAKSSGDTTLRALGKEIAARSTVSPADTQAVLVVLTERLAEGKIVRLSEMICIVWTGTAENGKDVSAARNNSPCGQKEKQ